MADILEIKRALTSRAGEVAEHLLPRGILCGRDWCAGSVHGEPGESLKVCVRGAKSGAWADFAAAGESGDLIDLWCQVKRQSLVESLDDIRAWLGMEAPKFERKATAYRRPERPQCAAPKSAVLQYLTGERGISSEAISAYRVAETGRTIVLPSLLPDGELAFVKYLDIDRPNGKKHSWVEPGCEPVLFGWQAIDSEAREIAITEGEIDAMTAYDFGFPSLSVPFGGGGGAKQQWIESEYDRMSRFEVIYLALDGDPEGNIAAEEIANRLGRHRCRRVTLPRKDMNQCRKDGIGAEEIRACFEASKSLDPPELLRAGLFADATVGLFWPSGERAQGYQLPFMRTAQKLIFRPSELTEWTGATGAGKSQLLSYALVGMGEQGARVCIASLEMAPAQLIRRMVKQAGNSDRPPEPFIRHIIFWLDQWLWLYGIVGKTDVTRLLEVFEYARCRYDCDVFAIDSLMRLGVGSEDYEGQERAVYQIVNWAVAKAVHVHLVAHARKSDRSSAQSVPEAEDIKGTSEIASNAFNIIGIWRNRKREEAYASAEDAVAKGEPGAAAIFADLKTQPPITANVSKQRNGDWEGKFGLWFSPMTYQYRSSQDAIDGRRFVPAMPDAHAAE